MEERIVEDTTTNEQSVDSYFQYIWKDRLNWTKHVIPVRFKMPEQEFFLEGYISAPPSPDDLDVEVEVESAFLFTSSINTFLVPLRDIYPSKRNLTKIKESNIEQVEILKQYQPLMYFQEFSNIFTIFPRYQFTIPEIESIINRLLLNSEKSKLIEGKDKLCLITNTLQKAYVGVTPSMLTFGDKVEMDFVTSIKDLNSKYQSCTDCNLGQKRVARGCSIVTNRLGNTVGAQPTSPFIMFIGEAPGVQEEENKTPFYTNAPAGDLLSRVINAAKIDIDTCYFTNAVWCRPEPKDINKMQNGTPSKEEIVACNKRLKNEILIINPKVIVLLGKSAYYSFFGKDLKSILDVVGWQTLTSNVKVYLMPHPSYVLRELSFATPENKTVIKKAYLNHFLEINKVFKEVSNI